MAKMRKRKFSKKMQIKLMAIFAFVLLLLVGLNIRIVYIMKKSGDKYTKQVLSQQRYDSRTIPFKRGEVQDRNGNILARSEKVYNLVLDCYAVNEEDIYIEPTVKALVNFMEVEEAEVRKRLTSEETKDSQYQVLRKKVTIEEKQAFSEAVSVAKEKQLTPEERREKENIRGIWFEEQYNRQYPMDQLASNVIGFSNNNNDGVVGLEAYYSDILNGVNGREFGYLNEDSELQRTLIEPKNGNTLISTMDINIQEIVERYIKEFDQENSGGPSGSTIGHGSKNTAVIVGNPKTGEIYAMATNQGFDLNNPHDLTKRYTETDIKAMSEKEIAEALNQIWSNFCVSEAFEPGSTVKPITVSSALETGALKGDEMFYCDGSQFVTDTTIYCDNENGHGEETISDAIKNSCNDALMQIGAKLSITDFCKYQRLFNFGNYTGIDLPNENPGVLYTKDTMHEVELATCSFGQGFTCSMVQEWAAFNAVVNGGYYYRPRMVKQIQDSTGGVVKSIDSLLLSQPISARSSALLKEALYQGVETGTGQKAQVPGYKVSGKTGTAEKLPRGQGNYIVSFIGAVPADDPQVVAYVVIDEPNVEDQATGGYAQILFRKIMMEVLPYLDIYRTEAITEEQLGRLGLTPEEATAGRNANQNETAETDAEGNPVETENGVAENPNLPAPPEGNNENSGNDRSGFGITDEDLGIE